MQNQDHTYIDTQLKKKKNKNPNPERRKEDLKSNKTKHPLASNPVQNKKLNSKINGGESK